MKVFIAGCGRSGTTYARTLLNAHPDLFIPGECLFLIDYLRFNECLPSRIAERLFWSEPQLRAWYRRGRVVWGSNSEVIDEIHSIEAGARGAKYWGQKTPRFIRWMACFEGAFPDIRWVLLYRNPKAVVASMLRSKQHTYSVPAAVRRWKRDNEEIVQYVKCGEFPDNVLVLKYEDLVRKLEPTLARIWRFLELQPVSLDHILQTATVDLSIGARFTNNAIRDGLKPQAEITERWRQSLSQSQKSYIEKECRQEMEVLGYRRFEDGTEEPISFAHLHFARILDAKILFEYLLNWPSYLVFAGFRMFLMRFFCAVRRL